MVHVHFGDLSGDGIHFILILHAVHDELHLILPVIQVVILLHELDVIPAQLGGEDVLGGCGIDVPLIPISVVVVVAVQGHGLGSDLVGLHHQADGLGQFVQELVAGILGAPLQLEDNVLFAAVNGGVEVAASVDLVHQLAHNGCTGPALVAGVAGQNRSAVIIERVQGHHIARLIIVHFDLRVHAQEDGAHAAAGLLLKGGAGIGSLGERCCAGAVPAGGQGGHGQGGGQSQAEQFGSVVLLHLIHLLRKSGFVWRLYG